MGRCVHLVCDYAPGDLAWSEILSALAEKLPDSTRFVQTSVNSFDTVSTGFIVAQLGRRPGNAGHVVFANCAPRKDLKTARTNNEGEGLVYVQLDNGSQLVVVNSGFSLSFVKPYIKKFHATKASASGSQFRSRDNFPGVLAQCLENDTTFLDKELDVSLIPDVPLSVVGYVDSFGNIKTTIRRGDALLAGLKEGDRVSVKIGKNLRYATVTNGSFSVKEGEIAFAPGSSGYDSPFWELFKRGGSASVEFGGATAGSRITIEAA